MTRRQRKRLFVDRRVQGAILIRVVIYWACCLLFLTMPLVIARTLEDPGTLIIHHVGPVIQSHWPLLLLAALMLPFAAYDALKLSNRLAGPLFRLRRELGRFAAGEDIEPVRFRTGDFWGELAEQVNGLLGRVREAETRLREAEARDRADAGVGG